MNSLLSLIDIFEVQFNNKRKRDFDEISDLNEQSKKDKDFKEYLSDDQNSSTLDFLISQKQDQNNENKKKIQKKQQNQDQHQPQKLPLIADYKNLFKQRKSAQRQFDFEEKQNDNEDQLPSDPEELEGRLEIERKLNKHKDKKNGNQNLLKDYEGDEYDGLFDKNNKQVGSSQNVVKKKAKKLLKFV